MLSVGLRAALVENALPDASLPVAWNVIRLAACDGSSPVIQQPAMSA